MLLVFLQCDYLFFIQSGEGEEPMTALDAERLAQGTQKTQSTEYCLCHQNGMNFKILKMI